MQPPTINKILVFDVETTGLLPKSPGPLDQYPHIIQMSFILFDKTENRIVKTGDYYIRQPHDCAEIPEKVIEITGITADMCYRRGVPISYALREFCEMYEEADCIVAHNFEFDQTVVDVEIARLENSVKSPFQESKKYHYCTMQSTVDLCNIQSVSPKTGKTYKKYPRLSELHTHLFGKNRDDEIQYHNSLVDTEVCLRCFLQLVQ